MLNVQHEKHNVITMAAVCEVDMNIICKTTNSIIQHDASC